MKKEDMIKEIYAKTEQFRGKEQIWRTLFLGDIIWYFMERLKTPSSFDHFMNWFLPLLVLHRKERTKTIDKQKYECIKLVYERLIRYE